MFLSTDNKCCVWTINKNEVSCCCRTIISRFHWRNRCRRAQFISLFTTIMIMIIFHLNLFSISALRSECTMKSGLVIAISSRGKKPTILWLHRDTIFEIDVCILILCTERSSSRREKSSNQYKIVLFCWCNLIFADIHLFGAIVFWFVWLVGCIALR